MLYQAYQAHFDIMVPVRVLAAVARTTAGLLAPNNLVLRNLTAAYELISRACLTHVRPPFGIDRVMIGNREVEVAEEAARVTPFAVATWIE